MTNLLKTTGLTVFVTGFTFFNAILFWGDYRISEKQTLEVIGDTRRASLLLRHSKGLLDETFPTSFAFVSKLRHVFDTVNAEQIDTYSITAKDINALVSQNNPTFTINSVEAIFKDSTAVSAFKIKSLRDFAGHLDGQTFASPEALRARLNDVSDKIKRYGTLSAVGIDRYQARDITYALTKKATVSPVKDNPLFFLLLSIGVSVAGALLYIIPKVKDQPGMRNNGIFFSVMKNTGWLGILTGTWLMLFYVLLYFYPEYMTQWIILVDPLSHALNGGEAGRFFLYGFMYTLCILVMGVRMMIHYRDSRYHLLRTLSVMFFQTAFAFLIPEILVRLNQPYYDFKNIWPLDYTFFFDYRLKDLINNGTLGIFMLGWGITLIIIGVPILVYFFGKRWYCSWVCGCGGLAETLGDPFRQLSNKTVKAWRIERWMVHGVLVFAIAMTAGVLYTFFTGASWFLVFDTYVVREIYGVMIGSVFAGVVGTGFYPLMGNRVWCRFGCPLAAYLGLVQRFKSRFRITTNGGQCISCGNCSTYCEMGIDVRWYAQRGQNVIRSSCVGCGVCSSVCPRGVLNLEVKDEDGRFGNPILIGNNGITVSE